jgi:segregation and condensation protein B
MEGLKSVVRTRSDRVISRLVRDLSLRYDARHSALEVKVLPGSRAVMRLREKYDQSVKRFTTRPLLTIGPLKTLSYIAYHQPVSQSQVVEDRGSHVYSHLKQMEEMGLINREKNDGRSYTIETTAYFADYFGFGHNPMNTKIQLRRMFKQIKIHKLDNGEDESATQKALDIAFAGSPLGESSEKLP